MFDKVRNALPGGLHLHTVWEMFSSLFNLRESELKASDFGKGWGDEHQWLELLMKLKSGDRDIFERFIVWHYLGRKRLEGVTADRALRHLREFITSWDRDRVEIGTMTTKTNRQLKATTINIEEVKKVFGKGTTNGQKFIEECVTTICKAAGEAHAKLLAARQLPTPQSDADHKLFEEGCLHYGYVALVRRFRTAQIPTLPIGDEQSFSRRLDQMFEKMLGKDFSLNEAAVFLDRAMDPLLKRRERRQQRLRYVYTRIWLWWAIPIVLIYNIFKS